MYSMWMEKKKGIKDDCSAVGWSKWCARCWDGENGERTVLRTRGVRSSFEGTGSPGRLEDSQVERNAADSRLEGRGDGTAGEGDVSVSTGWGQGRRQGRS